MKIKTFSIAATLCLSLLPAMSFAAYVITNLGNTLTAHAYGCPQGCDYETAAYDINDSNQIVGYFSLYDGFTYDMSTDTFREARYYLEDHVTIVGDSIISGVNNNGDIVGYHSGCCGQTGTGNWSVKDGVYAFEGGSLWETSIDDSGNIFAGTGYSGPTDLMSMIVNPEGWSSIRPYGMNSAGYIVGQGRYLHPDFDRELYAAFILQPVPIPPTLYLFGFGLLGLIGVSKRKKLA